MATIVDLRSDTVTRPSAGMRRAMADAEVGDDVFGDDPTARRLQTYAAELFGFEASLFFPSGTQSNLAALMAHCGRGDEVILGREAHSYVHEAGGAAVLGSIHMHTLANRSDGTLDLDEVAAAVKPHDDPHYARTRLLALENTIGGRALTRAYLEQAVARARQLRLATHLDGARIFNAATALRMEVKALCAGFDSVSVCLSKGLGAPAGTLLLGNAQLIASAVRIRKVLGGGMRQVGILAAAGIYALEHNVSRLQDDHAAATRLAQGLSELGMPAEQHTNMVFTQLSSDPARLAHRLRQHGVIVRPDRRMRLVTHLDIDAAGIDRAIAAFAACGLLPSS
jgi:threonine aldolase